MPHSLTAVTPYNSHHHFKYFLLPFQGITSEVVDRVYKEYMGDAESPAQVRDGLLDAMGDMYFVISAVEVARYHRGNSAASEQL